MGRLTIDDLVLNDVWVVLLTANDAMKTYKGASLSKARFEKNYLYLAPTNIAEGCWSGEGRSVYINGFPQCRWIGT